MLDGFKQNVNFRTISPENLILSSDQILKKCEELHENIAYCEEPNCDTVLKVSALILWNK